MIDDFDIESNAPVDASPRPVRGRSGIAWFVIAGVVVFVLFPHRQRGPAQDGEASDGGAILKIQSRILVGGASLENSGSNKLYYAQAAPFNTGPVGQRFRFIVLAGELAGPEVAVREIRDLDQRLDDHDIELSLEQTRIRDILRNLYTEYSHEKWTAPKVVDPDREFLKEELGWFGELALAPHSGPDTARRDAVIGPARRSLFAVFALLAWFTFLCFAGVAGWVVFLVLAASGNIASGVNTGSPFGAIYAETFACWFVTFFGLNILLSTIGSGETFFVGITASFFLSLLALAWPVWRGVPWSQVREDIGLFAGKRPTIEPAIGVAAYAMTLPFLLVAICIVFILVVVTGAMVGASAGGADSFQPVEMPTHPVVESPAGPGTGGLLRLLLLASVAAPIVEETMFRGVLYRHLREVSARFGFVVSVLFAVVFNSFLFAVIHPQGWLAVPMLMTLAAGFSLVRQWRGTIIPAIIGHALNNAAMVFLIFQMQ